MRQSRIKDDGSLGLHWCCVSASLLMVKSLNQTGKAPGTHPTSITHIQSTDISLLGSMLGLGQLFWFLLGFQDTHKNPSWNLQKQSLLLTIPSGYPAHINIPSTWGSLLIKVQRWFPGVKLASFTNGKHKNGE